MSYSANECHSIERMSLEEISLLNVIDVSPYLNDGSASPHPYYYHDYQICDDADVRPSRYPFYVDQQRSLVLYHVTFLLFGHL